MAAVQLGEVAGHLVAEGALQRQRGGLEHGDVDACLASGGRGLEPDPAAADDDHRRRGCEGAREAPRCPRHGARCGPARRRGCRARVDVRRWRGSPCRSEMHLAVEQADARARPVSSALDGAAVQQTYVVLPIPGGWRDDSVVERRLTHEEVLRERRALVRRMLFVADDRDRAQVPVLAQGDRGRCCRETCADDDDVHTCTVSHDVFRSPLSPAPRDGGALAASRPRARAATNRPKSRRATS